MKRIVITYLCIIISIACAVIFVKDKMNKDINRCITLVQSKFPNVSYFPNHIGTLRNGTIPINKHYYDPSNVLVGIQGTLTTTGKQIDNNTYLITFTETWNDKFNHLSSHYFQYKAINSTPYFFKDGGDPDPSK